MTQISKYQKEQLLRFLGHAFIVIRNLCWSGDVKDANHAADLADAVHNIPYFMDSPDFDWDIAEEFVLTYQEMYPAGEHSFNNFLIRFREIRKGSKET